MILEPTEEQRQLAEQARSYGKQMVALQSGEERSPPTPLQDEPVEEVTCSVRETLHNLSIGHVLLQHNSL